MGFAYLAALLVSLTGMALIDRRLRLVLWRDPLRSLAVIALGIGFFVLWDLAAIALGHYHVGAGPFQTGVLLAPELPLEELVFITFFCYLTLVLWGVADVGLRRLRRPPGGEA